ncbi:hypothetical protein [Baaleninema sp.]|uniref:hypothetical protein n=1 Tax=Baaleninema sp. TaxID=3101197 RepID=UPI003D07620F
MNEESLTKKKVKRDEKVNTALSANEIYQRDTQKFLHSMTNLFATDLLVSVMGASR